MLQGSDSRHIREPISKMKQQATGHDLATSPPKSSLIHVQQLVTLISKGCLANRQTLPIGSHAFVLIHFLFLIVLECPTEAMPHFLEHSSVQSTSRQRATYFRLPSPSLVPRR